MLRVVLVLLALQLLPGCILVSHFKTTPMPEGGREVKDVAYWSGEDFDTRKHRLNLYVPPGAGPHPVVMFVHGGGWIFGDRDFGQDVYGRLGRRLATQGILTAVVSYRLAPSHKHPAHIRDVARATAFTLAHVAEHGGDPKRVFLMGHSAGAQLVSLLACDPRWLAEQGTTPSSLAGVIALSGPYDVQFMARSLVSGAPMVVPTFGADHAVWRDVSPAAHLKEGRPPPFLIAVGDSEPIALLRQARDFADALEQAKVPVAEQRIELKDHFTIIMDLGEEGDALGAAVKRFVESGGAPSSGTSPLRVEHHFAF